MPATILDRILNRILNCGIVAVVRAEQGDQLVEVAEALLAGGVEAIEVTFTVPAAHRVIERVAERLGDRIVLGAGTVLDPETARIAILSGAHNGIHPETVQVYTRLVASKRRLRIDQVEHGGPWTRCSFRRKEGGLENHYLLLNHGGIARVKPRIKNT